MAHSLFLFLDISSACYYFYKFCCFYIYSTKCRNVYSVKKLTFSMFCMEIAISRRVRVVHLGTMNMPVSACQKCRYFDWVSCRNFRSQKNKSLALGDDKTMNESKSKRAFPDDVIKMLRINITFSTKTNQFLITSSVTLKFKQKVLFIDRLERWLQMSSMTRPKSINSHLW